MRKKILIILFYMIILLNTSFSQDKKEKKQITKPMAWQISYWSTYGLIGLTSMVNTFANLGNAYSISNDIADFSVEIKQYSVPDDKFVQFANYYPAVMFGFHFFTSGLAFIPVAGGIAYGGALIAFGTSFALIRSLSLVDFEINFENELYDLSKYENQFWDIYDRIFDPTVYFVMGVLSILFGVGEIITFMFYKKSIKKNKFPYIEKSISFYPNGMVIKLDI